MHVGSYESFTECYIALLKEIYRSPVYTSAPRGMKIKETLGVSFTIKNPRDRIPYVVGRKFSMGYMVAELIWYLAANDKTDWISRYSSFWSNITDDGVTANSAYGARLFQPHQKIAQGRFTQYQYVINELKRDPDSRRAVMHLRVPDDSIDAVLDMPCTLALQFFVRDNKLDMIVHMRSSDLVFGIAYDVPAFTLFQEILANELCVDLGSYTHMSNSLHIYKRHFKMVEKILHPASIEKSKEAHAAYGPMPNLQSSSLFDLRSELFKLEVIEQQLFSATSNEQIQAAVHGDIHLNDPMFEDWAIVLARKWLKKKKLGDLANYSLNFDGYNF